MIRGLGITKVRALYSKFGARGTGIAAEDTGDGSREMG